MSTQQGTAAKVARDYFSAWSAKDVERTVSYAADEIVCDMPTGRFEGTEQFRKLWTDFLAMTIGADLIAVYGDDAGDEAITKLVPWAKPDPFAVVRGTN